MASCVITAVLIPIVNLDSTGVGNKAEGDHDGHRASRAWDAGANVLD